jgi:NADH-quinone oxidoreductase subunit G
LVQSGHAGKANSGLLALYPHANTQGVFDMTSPQPVPESAEVAWLIGVGDGEAVPQAPFTVVQELFLTDLARQADVVLPALSFAEREGTFTSGDRRVQRYYRALPALGQAKPDWWIVQEAARRLGAEWNYMTAAQIFGEIAKQVPYYAGLSYEAISHTEAQWPPMGRGDLYYGGTVYDNSGGLGARYAAGAEREGFTAAVQPVAPPEVDIEALQRAGRMLYQDGELIRRSNVLAAHVVNGETEIARAAR